MSSFWRNSRNSIEITVNQTIDSNEDENEEKIQKKMLNSEMCQLI